MTVDDLYAARGDAFRRHDVDAILALLTSDYTLYASGAPPLMGRDSMRPALAQALATYDISPSFERLDLLVDGDLAVDFGWDVQTVTPRAGSEPKTARQRVVLVMRRQADGRWLFARGLSQPAPVASNG